MALGGDVRFAATRLLKDEAESHDGELLERAARRLPRLRATSSRPRTSSSSWSATACRWPRPRRWCRRCSPTASCCSRPRREAVMVPDASLRGGLLHRPARPGDEGAGSRTSARRCSRAPPASARSYRFDAAHAKNVARAGRAALRRAAHRARAVQPRPPAARGGGAAPRHRHLREPARPPQALAVPALGLRDLRPVARGHWRSSRTSRATTAVRCRRSRTVAYMALDSDTRVVVNKLAAILRLANALDADHLQKVRDLKRGVRGRRRGARGRRRGRPHDGAARRRLALRPDDRGLRPAGGLPRGEHADDTGEAAAPRGQAARAVPEPRALLARVQPAACSRRRPTRACRSSSG